jgi:RNA polymerase sigma factor (sigma-70 family)
MCESHITGGDASAAKGDITVALQEFRNKRKGAHNRLYELIYSRFRNRVMKALNKSFPKLRPDYDPEDVIAKNWKRVDCALLACDPRNSRELFNVVGCKIRQILIDLARAHDDREQAITRDKLAYFADRNITGVDSASTRISDTEQIYALRVARGLLDPEENELLNMRFATDMTLEEIASVLDINHGTVSRRLQKVIKKLRGSMEGENS